MARPQSCQECLSQNLFCINPYGIVTVPSSIGALHRGELLVRNFNNSANEQGTGTTIVQVPQAGNDGMAGDASVFAQINPDTLPGRCPGGVGLTTALAVTRSGFVIVGSLPTADGTAATAKAGCLLVLNSRGRVLETIAGGPINGPWDMTAVDHGAFTTLYVTNVLNGTVAAGTNASGQGNVVDHGTVVRIQLLTIPGVRPFVLDEDVIGTGFPERTDPGARGRPDPAWRWAPTARCTWPTHRTTGSPRSPERRSVRSRSRTAGGTVSLRRGPERAARHDAGAERRHPHGQRRRRASSRPRRLAPRPTWRPIRSVAPGCCSG